MLTVQHFNDVVLGFNGGMGRITIIIVSRQDAIEVRIDVFFLLLMLRGKDAAAGECMYQIC